MKNVICSENFIKFFSGIDQIGLSIEELMNAIRENIHHIAWQAYNQLLFTSLTL